MMTDVAEATAVGLAEIKVSKRASDVLVAYGLGSCIAICAYDPAVKVAGMVHVMLPQSDNRENNGMPGKYADTAIPKLLDELTRLGADRKRLVIKIAGGAQMLAGSGLGNKFNIGERNAEAVKAGLSAAGLRLTANDTGGNCGRTVHLQVGTGKISVRTVGGATKEI